MNLKLNKDDFEAYKRDLKLNELDRINRMLNSPVLMNLFGGSSTFDLEKAMNSGKVIIFDLGDLSDMTAKVFGKFIIASIKSIARKRKKNK